MDRRLAAPADRELIEALARFLVVLARLLEVSAIAFLFERGSSASIVALTSPTTPTSTGARRPMTSPR